MNITLDQLMKIMPQARTQLAQHFLDEFNAQLPEYDIDSPLRIAAYLAQGAYESGELRELVENMYYTTPQRLQQVWPSRFPTVASALPYTKNPEKLGNFVYANRMGNGDAASGDGYRYRGRGWFNGTGKAFYQEMTNLTKHDFITSPDDMAIPQYAVLSACREWADSRLNQYADAGDFTKITKIINGGLTGLNGRLVYYLKAKKVFGIDS
ncbi:glycoside hydrolase family 19 protein [Niabella soli]|uniref:Lytic enzyme n=1 Tax=Niabella soli DSM 19437 TaxID=929713 RepID=W0EWB4_9BACT|nr:glycoside hydrolase family 19 protein [Niabella soli]AHF15077.1 lytic enzyme [Niabella soli DSM 19437]